MAHAFGKTCDSLKSSSSLLLRLKNSVAEAVIMETITVPKAMTMTQMNRPKWVAGTLSP